jgi:alkanesulfonate monooxygenase SsuD/methylene tetrahydromethanopterin reductase-like flavin-dependent oxidoreductase (luciferase family)
MSTPFLTRPLFDIWQETSGPETGLSWRARMVDYTAYFPTQEAAEKYVNAVKEYRSRYGSGPRMLEPHKDTVHRK